MNNIEIYKEPLSVKTEFDKESEGAEMTDWELGFLCGLIKKFRPHKILEIGVAAGGTTAVIANCLRTLNLDTEVHSIDYNEVYYRNPKLKTGYLAEKIIQETRLNHHFHLGGYSVEFMKEIGARIDFLILDTVHSMPGEFLDFLAWLPYLNEGAIVVLHDVGLNQINSKARDSVATKILFDSVYADKFYQINPEYNIITIGAFLISKKTVKEIYNVFSALFMNWKYIPTQTELNLYETCYEKHYDSVCMNLFKCAVEANRNSVQDVQAYKKVTERMLLLQWGSFLKDIYHTPKPIYLYGKGKVAGILTDVLVELGIEISNYIVSEPEIYKYMSGSGVIALEEVPKDSTIVIAVSQLYQEEICVRLEREGYNNIITMGSYILNSFLEI